MFSDSHLQIVQINWTSKWEKMRMKENENGKAHMIKISWLTDCFSHFRASTWRCLCFVYYSFICWKWAIKWAHGPRIFLFIFIYVAYRTPVWYNGEKSVETFIYIPIQWWRSLHVSRWQKTIFITQNIARIKWKTISPGSSECKNNK